MAEREEPFEPLDAELSELRDAWRTLRAPDPNAAEPDAAERAAVDWMRMAWSALEPPAAAPPRALFRPRLVRRLVPLAAAAALFVAGLLALRALAPERDGRAPIVQSTEPAAPPTTLAALERAEGGLELRHGSVRLILLEPDPPPAPSGEAR